MSKGKERENDVFFPFQNQANMLLSFCASLAVIFLLGLIFKQKKRLRDQREKHDLLQEEKVELEATIFGLQKLTSPLENVTKILLELARDPTLSEKQAQTLQLALEALTRDDLFVPDVEKEIQRGKLKADDDTKSWLLSEVMLGHHPRHPTLDPSMATFDPSRLDVEEFDGAFTNLNSWSFDIFRVEQTYSNTLSNVAYKVMLGHGLIEELALDVSELMRLLNQIEKGYRMSNAYHNSVHAADVIQTMGVLLASPYFSGRLAPLEKFSVLLAAAIHDFDHPGVTNNFLITTQDPLATLYNDQSPLENHHLAAGLEIIFRREFTFFSHLPLNDQAYARRLMIDLVLATDMARHFLLLANFNAKLVTENLDPEKSEDRILLLQMLMKCADISNPGKPLEIYLQWVDRITAEFFRQGDRERDLGLPISPFMDRTSPKIAKAQTNFIELICAPVYLSVGTQLSLPDLFKTSQKNLEYWKSSNLPPWQPL